REAAERFGIEEDLAEAAGALGLAELYARLDENYLSYQKVIDGENPTWYNWAVTVSNTNEQEGDTPSAVLSQFRARLREGDVRGALATADRLPDYLRDAMREPIDSLERMNDALDAISEVEVEVSDTGRSFFSDLSVRRAGPSPILADMATLLDGIKDARIRSSEPGPWIAAERALRDGDVVETREALASLPRQYGGLTSKWLATLGVAANARERFETWMNDETD
ncbi:MAG: hypothetical protein AAF658_09405, partial [Myxococcota bacterium]